MRLSSPNFNNRKQRANPWTVAAFIVAAIVLLCALCSCSSTRKVKSFEKSTIDSTSKKELSTGFVQKIDSAGIWVRVDSSKQESKAAVFSLTTEDFQLLDVDSGSVITFPADPADYFPTVVITKPNGSKQLVLPRKREEIRQQTSTSKTKTSSASGTSVVSRSDSSASRSSEETSKKETRITKNKAVAKSRINPFWLIAILAILYLLYRYRRQIKLLFAA